MKNLILRTFLSCFFVLFVSGLSFASGDWQLLFSKEGVMVYSKKVEHKDLVNGTHQEYVLLKMHNTNPMPVKISWWSALSYDGTCLTCNSKHEYTYGVMLKAGEVIEGDPAKNVANPYRIFSKFLNMSGSQLTDFTLESFMVTKK